MNKLSLEQLAVDIGDLRYAETAQFMDYLIQAIDASTDYVVFDEFYVHLSLAQESIMQAWNISQPYMLGDTRHKKTLQDYTMSLSEFANNLSARSISELTVFLDYFALDLERQAMQDSERGRNQLSNTVYEAADRLYLASDVLKDFE